MAKQKSSDDARRIIGEGSIGEWVERSALHPWRKNPRKNKAAIKPVAESIERLGFGAPIVARKSDGRVIAGHTRLLAAESLGLERVPVRWVDVDDRTADMLALADNRLGEIAEWDEPELLAQLGELGLDDAALVGWDQDALEKLGADLDPGDVEDVEPSPADEAQAKWNVERGQVWKLGRHRIMCGDSTSTNDVAQVLQGAPPDCVLTDPPYGLNKKMQGGTWATKAPHYNAMHEWDATADQAFFDCATAHGVPAIVWGGNYFSTPPSRGWFCWNKPMFPTMADVELAWSNLDHNAKRFDSARVLDGPKAHPTQKPVALMVWCLGFLDGKTVFDPFSGSGTTIIACEQLGKSCRAIEISPSYVAVAIERWVTLTGGTPVLDA